MKNLNNILKTAIYLLIPLLLCHQQLNAVEPISEQQLKDANYIKIPMEKLNGLYWIKGLMDNTPVDLIVDTGFTHSSITQGLAKQLNKKITQTSDHGVAFGGEKIPQMACTVNQLLLFDGTKYSKKIKIHGEFSVYAVNKNITKFLNKKNFGFIGHALLKTLSAIVDFKNANLYLKRPTYDVPKKGFPLTSLISKNHARISGTSSDVRFHFKAQADGHLINLGVDSGSSALTVFDEKKAESLELSLTKPEKPSTSFGLSEKKYTTSKIIAHFDLVAKGELKNFKSTFKNVGLMDFTASNQINKQYKRERIDGYVGLPFLIQCGSILDYKNDHLYLNTIH